MANWRELALPKAGSCYSASASCCYVEEGAQYSHTFQIFRRSWKSLLFRISWFLNVDNEFKIPGMAVWDNTLKTQQNRSCVGCSLQICRF